MQSERVGIFCSYVPGEILHAAGFVPAVVFGKSSGQDISAAYLPLNFCSYVRNCVNEVYGENGFSIKGVIATDSCNAMQRLCDIFQKNPGLDFVHCLEVPRRTDSASLDFFRSGLQRLADFISAYSGCSIDEDKLGRSISVFNETRRLLKKVSAFQNKAQEQCRGSEIARLIKSGLGSPREQMNKALQNFLNDQQPRPPACDGRKKIILAGAFSYPIELIDLIEEHGGQTVCEDTCLSRALNAEEIDMHGDLLGNLALGYLKRSPCPRMQNGVALRSEELLQTVKKHEASGVIYYSIKFCSPHAYAYALLRERLSEAGIPCLLLEGDGRNSLGQIRTRIQAFMEILE